MIIDNCTPDPSAFHPVDLLEPIENHRSEADERAIETLSLVFQMLLPQRKTNLAIRLEEGWKRFVALSALIRPDLLDGVSQTFLANMTDCSPACISKIMVELSDRLGIVARSQKTAATREAMTAAHLQREPASHKRTLGANTGKQRHDEAVRDAIYEARRRWKQGKPFTRFQTLSLLEVGFMETDHATLTPAALAWLESKTKEIPCL